MGILDDFFGKPKVIYDKKVAFIGLGKLGMPCAEAIVKKGFDVIGYDTERKSSNFVDIKHDLKEAVEDRDIIFIAVPTPHEPGYDGRDPTSDKEVKDFDYTAVKETIKRLNDICDRKQIIVLISTVLPGTIRREFQPLLTNTGLVYNPYLIAMGTVADDMVNPEMIMIGTEKGWDGPVCAYKMQVLTNFYNMVCDNYPRIETGTWEEMESIKIFYNTFISNKIALVNMIQDVAHKMGNIDVDKVTTALSKSTKRIVSPAYMKAGMGDGGACHPRDNIALRWMSENLDLGYDLFDAIMEAREIQAKNLAARLVEPGLPVVIVGKAYKPHVHYVDGSYSILVGHFVEELGGTVYYDDDYTGDKPPANLGPASYLLGHDPESAFLGCLDPDPDKEDSSIFPQGSVIIDPWRKCPQIPGCTVVHYGNTRLNG